MKKTVPSLAFSILIVLFAAGCGNSDPGGPHHLVAPDPPGSYKVPVTKAEKIAAINRAGISADQKKAAIAKVNAGP